MQTDTPTVSEVVHEAAGLTDPDGHDDAIASMLTAFEDDDREATLRVAVRTAYGDHVPDSVVAWLRDAGAEL